MCRLLETIRVDDGIPRHLAYHEARMVRARAALFGMTDAVSLAHFIIVPHNAQQGTVRCRIVYGRTIESIEFIPYSRRVIASLKLVYDDTICYKHKLLDRSALERLAEQRGDADEVLIVRGGIITDTTFSNIAFFDGSDWITPAQPLLTGTARERLISQGLLKESLITPDNLGRFTAATLVNAMLDPGDITIDIARIS